MNHDVQTECGETPAGRSVRTGGLRHLCGALAGALIALSPVTAAWASEPTPTPEPTAPANPTASSCVSNTKLTSFTTSGSPFQGGTTLSWKTTKGCPEVTIRLNNATVAASGAQLVDPTVGTVYRLSASMGIVSKNLGSQLALGGDIINWFITPRWGLMANTNSALPAPREAGRIAAEITGKLTPTAKTKFIGREIEIHLIPWNGKLTDLPYFSHLTGKEATRGIELPWLVQPNIHAVAVGEETLVQHPNRLSDNAYGYNLAHELGHLLLDFAFIEEMSAVIAAHETVKADADHTWFGLSEYPHVENSHHEHFAEATAAFFYYEKDAAHWGYYKPNWLAQAEPAMFEILRRQYGNPA